ncbi:MAG: ankyrin repeat domain-containing protein [Coxiellaceae bacterium]|nr:ankyrin repeat domain-containing protein [Coxiellaceae bacterium]
MPKWTDYRETTLDNYLSTFTSSEFQKLIQGSIQLVVPNKGEHAGKRFYACDVRSTGTPRYWAVVAGAHYFAFSGIISDASLRGITLNLQSLLELAEKSSQSMTAFYAFYAFLDADELYDALREHYNKVGKQLVDRLVAQPKALVDVVSYVLTTHPTDVDHVIRLLKNIKKYCRHNTQYRELLNATHEGQSVLSVLLAHPDLPSQISKDQYFNLMDILHQYARVPATPALVEKGVLWYPEHKKQFNHVLIWAADCPDNAMVCRLLTDNAIARNVDADYVYPNGKETALHAALRVGASDEVVRQLVAQTIKLNHQDQWGYTPLMLAAKNNRADVVKMLLRYQAVEQKLSLRDNRGLTALHHAAQATSVESLHLLLAQPHMTTALVNRLNKNGDSALALACKVHHMQHVTALLAHQANVYSSNKQKQSAADLAMGDEETLKLLHPGVADYLEVVDEAKSYVVSAPSITAKLNTVSYTNDNDRRLVEYKAKVITLLQKQLNGDSRYTRDVPIVRKHIDAACEAVERATTLSGIHRVLDQLHRRQVLWPERNGKTTPRSYLRSTTVVQFKFLGFLTEKEITGKACFTAFRQGLFCGRRAEPVRLYEPPKVTPSAPASDPLKPNNVQVMCL